MNLYRIVYASTLSESFNSQDIEHILASSRRNNKKQDVSGMLLFSHRYFLQCLEGSRDNINQTYQRILSDERHCRVTIVSYENVTQREFCAWSMGYVPESHLTRELLFKFSASATFDPYTLSNVSALALLKSLHGTVI
ncbi:BLUF domain-containing protein [Motilimonas sp. 1_MG-2023]|uniref:BLUF domain-containing protein n=1 Tax=Motilimonas sp. 1_MG-2023 TaxID=3062672 RepID=UPI0026E14119|nr:BLUF domain-containing protein [Motilimonas sp. 1_MG-2023]MDO6527389.1 BLUF domain-containing protein [Motilimonas sp. 1_MG-2023]